MSSGGQDFGINPKDVESKNNAVEITASNITQNVNVIRSGSQATLVKNSDGTVRAVRTQSRSDVGIAVMRKLSTSSRPNLLNSFSINPTETPVEPMLGAQDALNKTKGEGEYFEHLWPLESLADKYETHLDTNDIHSSRGLTELKAQELLKQFGPNILTPPPKVPLWLLFLLQFTDLLMVLLLITGLLTFILYAIDPNNKTNLYLGVLLYIVVFLTCYETFSQQAKSDSLMEKFRALQPESAAVIRDGIQKPVPAAELVPGDLIKLKSGDKIPADCRIVFSQSLKADQASLTGESEPVDVYVDCKSQIALEAKNIIFNGSLVVDGSCMAVVIRTGDGCLIGKMVSLTGETGKSSSTLQKDIIHFVRILTAFALAQAVLIFAVGLGKGYDPVMVFINGFVIIMIGNVPQGLPTTITACLFIVAERMGKQNVLVKKLDIIESLGSCTCICTDKTGTLTQNLMSVAHTWFVNCKQVSRDFTARLKDEVAIGISPQMLTLMQVAALNSRIALEKKKVKTTDARGKAVEVEEMHPSGDATEIGLYRFFGEAVQIYSGKTVEEYRAANPKVHEIPFNSANKWQMSIHSIQEQGGSNVMFIKGAPDVLLSKCNRFIAQDGSLCSMDAQFNEIYTKIYEDFGGNGERVLGFAYYPLSESFSESTAKEANFEETLKERLVGKKNPDTAIKDLIFAGLVTLRDPPREEVPQAIKECHTAGVRVVMVTGDHPITAEAIARNIGLITKPTARTLAKERGVAIESISKSDPEIGAVVVRGVEICGAEGEGIPPMSDDDWTTLLSKEEIVFARTSPENKLTIVQQFTKAGHVTAMTGDGVNDSPALKQAAIGVAMGLNGSDVAREAGNMVLLDDNFASIVVGIREGRLLFANLKKSIAYTLAHLVPEVVPVLLWAFAGIPQPMGSILALCVDLLTELAPASSFAYEKAESNIMEVPPRNIKTDKLTSFPLLFYSYGQSGMILTGGCLFTYFMLYKANGISASDLFSFNNNYFPASDDGNVFTNSEGRTFNAQQQSELQYQTQGAWYLMIVVGQAAHVWVCRTCSVSIFEHGVFTNMHTNIAVLIALGLGCFVTYLPPLQPIVQSGNPDSLDIFYGALFVSAGLWGWSEGRKWFTRNYSSHWLNKWLAW